MTSHEHLEEILAESSENGIPDSQYFHVETQIQQAGSSGVVPIVQQAAKPVQIVDTVASSRIKTKSAHFGVKTG